MPSSFPTYVSVNELKAAINLDNNLADTDIERALHAASRAVEKVTSRQFYLDEDPTTRKYTALSPSYVYIDDIAEIDSVSISGTEVSEGVWFPEPVNNPVRGEPYMWLESDHRFPLRRQAIEVTGKFGWPEIPYQVKQIVIVVANKAIKRTREAPWGIVASGMIDGLTLRITRDDPDLQLYLEPLMRAETRRGQ